MAARLGAQTADCPFTGSEEVEPHPSPSPSPAGPIRAFTVKHWEGMYLHLHLATFAEGAPVTLHRLILQQINPRDFTHYLWLTHFNWL